MTLLKDHPEHKERVENNYLLKGQITDIINSYDFEDGDAPDITNEIMESVTEFINHNYTFKGI